MPATYRYGQVVAALSAVFGITPRARNAFRGRLQHLRDLGVPPHERAGTGPAAVYHHEDGLAMLLALELQRRGRSPKVAATTALSIVQRGPLPDLGGEHTFLVFDQPAIAFDRDQPVSAKWESRPSLTSLHEWIEEFAPDGGFTCFDVTALIARFDAALAETKTPPTDNERQEE